MKTYTTIIYVYTLLKDGRPLRPYLSDTPVGSDDIKKIDSEATGIRFERFI